MAKDDLFVFITTSRIPNFISIGQILQFKRVVSYLIDILIKSKIGI